MNVERGVVSDQPETGHSSLNLCPSFCPTQCGILFLLLVAALSVLLQGCGIRRTPDLERIFAGARTRQGKSPIIIIPGILGSQLVNRRTGEVVWPSAFRSADDELNLPTTGDLTTNRDELVAGRIVDTARLARLAPEVYVYYELLDTLKRYGGYREGDWNNPPPNGDTDTFYVFAYDWRRDNVETAAELVRRVEELKVKLQRPELRFNIVAHSMGGLVARYAAMYGDADLPDEAATMPVPTWAGASFISKVFMFGTPNAGSAEAFATLIEGYSITEGLRFGIRVRLLFKLSREVAFTVPSIFQLLPHSGAANFLDEYLRPLSVDLYDPATWRRYGWAMAAQTIREPDQQGKLKHRNRDGSDSGGDDSSGNGIVQPGELAGQRSTAVDDVVDNAVDDVDKEDAYLAAVLRRAKNFHKALNAAVGSDDPPVRLFVFGGDCEETLAAPILLRDKKRDRWQTLFAPRTFHTATKRRISRGEARGAMYEPGDGRVTRRSLLGESLAGLRISYAVFACDLHSDVQNNKTLQDNALTVLVGEAMK